MFRGVKGKVLLGGLVALLLSALGTGVALAHGGPPGPDPGPKEAFYNSVVERAAQILGIDADTLSSALQQARQEVAREQQDEAVSRLLDRWVEAGGISQEEADQILSWWQERPQAARPGLLRRAYHPRLGPNLILSPLVERGVLTQEEADALQSWWGSRPEKADSFLDLLRPPRPFHHGPPHPWRHHPW